jgi:hypothetical protein
MVCQISRYTRLLASDRDIAFLIHSIKSDLTPALGTILLVSYRVFTN